MEPKSFKMWQDHSVRYLEMAYRYDRCEKIERPDGYGKRTGDCGDTVEIYLSIGRGIIQSVSYQTDGCMNTNACANTVAELAERRKVEDAWEITPENVIAFLETLPPQNTHCAELAVGALYLALSNYQEHQRQPWKKLYSGK
jgi:nitrogen fixation protein NifU and related proteins